MSEPRGRKVPPDPNRPRLSAELEERLAPLDQRSAELLDRFEEIAADADELAADLEEGIVTLPIAESDTAVHELSELVRERKRPPEEGGG